MRGTFVRLPVTLPMNEATQIQPETPRRSRPGGARRPITDRRLVLAAAFVLVGAVLLAGWLLWLARSGDDSPETVKGPVGEVVEPVALSAAGLQTLARAVEEPIYWAGPQPGHQYELRRAENGNTYVRYLPRGVEAGAGGAKYLTVATYPFPRALAALEKAAGDRGVELPGGGVALVAAGRPTSVHVAFPGVDYQVEVYDPSPERALEVASSGDVRPAG